jgi:hypothetical protein
MENDLVIIASEVDVAYVDERDTSGYIILSV